jgi:hypothetical protein
MNNQQREIEFLGKKIIYIPIKNYLSLNKKRGMSFTNKRLNLKFHMIKNCLSFGKYGQLLLPVENNGNIQTVFEESFAHNHDDNTRMSLLCKNFNMEQRDSIEIDEAVPLYHLWSNGLTQKQHALYRFSP